MNACNAPFKQILDNAGVNSDSTLNKIKNSNNKTVYDLRTNTIKNVPYDINLVHSSRYNKRVKGLFKEIFKDEN